MIMIIVIIVIINMGLNQVIPGEKLYSLYFNDDLLPSFSIEAFYMKSNTYSTSISEILLLS